MTSSGNHGIFKVFIGFYGEIMGFSRFLLDFIGRSWDCYRILLDLKGF